MGVLIVFKDYPDVLTVKQVAEILNVSTRKVYDLINCHELAILPGIQKPKRIPKKFLEEYINSARNYISL